MTTTQTELGTSNGNFGKHYASMYEGSMMGSGSSVFAVWGYVIAKQVPGKTDADSQDMFVDLNPKLLAVLIGDTEEAMEGAIDFLCSADPRSRTDGESGARLVRINNFMFRVVNGRKYRAMQSLNRRREQNRQAQQRVRDRARIAAESAGREKRFVRADAAGDQVEADRIAAEGTLRARLNRLTPPTNEPTGEVA